MVAKRDERQKEFQVEKQPTGLRVANKKEDRWEKEEQKDMVWTSSRRKNANEKEGFTIKALRNSQNALTLCIELRA